ncbi:hypothetical protein [Streptomyces glomeratus]|uniref:hypothetical protein n=1 Tax=Streptomyces glomeratus TaxID=284452 RepID=UPI001F1800D2|nr:hypothetical protein [Streptomyces glomeratus]MCF1506700.1 hypothetical protein [Streptomyces glomeratus]
MPGRPSVLHGRISARYVRGFGAAVVAVAALVTAANAGPARAAQPEPVRHVHGVSPQDLSARDGSTR